MTGAMMSRFSREVKKDELDKWADSRGKNRGVFLLQLGHTDAVEQHHCWSSWTVQSSQLLAGGGLMVPVDPALGMDRHRGHSALVGPQPLPA